MKIANLTIDIKVMVKISLISILKMKLAKVPPEEIKQRISDAIEVTDKRSFKEL